MLKNQNRDSPEGIMRAMTSSRDLDPKNGMSKEGEECENRQDGERGRSRASRERCRAPSAFATLQTPLFSLFRPNLCLSFFQHSFPSYLFFGHFLFSLP